MKHFTLEEKFNAIKQVVGNESVGIHNFGLLHDIADALDMKNNSGYHLHSLSARISKIMRDLIKAEYPVKEYRIKCCSWSERETWHPLFRFESEKANDD